MNIIKYDKPARKWTEAMPLGNGFTGAMVYGSLKKEKICFNDCTLWSGYPKDYNSSESLKYLEEVQRLIFDGKNSEADALCASKLHGDYSEAYMPLGEVDLSFKNLDISGYSRSLDLEKAVHTVSSNGCLAEMFSSYPDRVTVYRIKSKTPFSVRITAKSKLKSRVVFQGKSLFLAGNAPDYAAPNYLFRKIRPIRYNERKAMAFCLQTNIETDGIIKRSLGSVSVLRAKSLTLFFVTETGFKGFDKMPCTNRAEVVNKCRSRFKNTDLNFERLKERHIADYTSLYNKQRLSFHAAYHGDTKSLVKSVRQGGSVKPLSELLYNYAKYLMISGSRKGGQALNLQGIWNNSRRPPWSSNYTVNINTQMNYWCASRCGLSDCIEPLIQMVYESVQNGEKTAEINYGCKGFACNHNVDLWRKTSPVKGSPSYMFAPLCGVWLANEIYFHYKNGYLQEYADKVAYIVTEAARFANDYLVMYNGRYVICPSASPENSFYNGSKACNLDYASSFDMGLVRQVFKNASEISKDSQLLAEIKVKEPLLYAFGSGVNGIYEWHKKYNVPEKGHRHFSPLYAFYPGDLIGYYADKTNADAVKRLFEYRLAHSGQHIGWSAAWALCISSRLRDPDTFLSVLRGMLSNCVFNNLFCVHPPELFQIDGNLGFAAGVNEMLLTEENGIAELLPALADEFKESGEVNDMVVQKAKISFKWENGSVTYLDSDSPVKIYNIHIASDAKIGENINLIDVI